MNDYAFGNFLYTLRTQKGLSQSQLGALLGVTNKAVSKWENGTAKPNTKLIPRLAQILEVTVEELFAGRRLENDSELAKLQSFLWRQKKKYAMRASLFFALLFVFPLLLISFIVLIIGMKLPDEIAGPIGSVSILICMVVSTVGFIIYRGNCKCFAGTVSNDMALEKKLKRFLIFSTAGLLTVCFLFPIIIKILWILYHHNARVTALLSSVAVSLFALLLGSVIFSIKFSKLYLPAAPHLRTAAKPSPKQKIFALAMCALFSVWVIIVAVLGLPPLCISVPASALTLTVTVYVLKVNRNNK